LTTVHWKVIPHRDVKRKDVPLLENAGLYNNYMAVINTLKQNPYSHEYSQEVLNPRSKRIYSMRINASTVVSTPLIRKIMLLKYGQRGHTTRTEFPENRRYSDNAQYYFRLYCLTP
jgi:Txe/YoeB family toxin of Txe-Axe toxin-antitoxin module